MYKHIIYIILLITSFCIIFLIHRPSEVNLSLAIEVFAALCLYFLDAILSNIKWIWLFIITKTYYYNKTIRVSISYLYKIKVNDRYLLVRGERMKHQFQPVGGVYKRLRESYYQLRDLNVKDDDNIPIDDKSINDLRIRVKGKNVTTLLSWYDSQLGREVSPYREFYEELIRTQYLDYKIFPYVNYYHVRRHQTPIHYSDHFKCHEILIAEIFELRVDEDQEKELVKKMGETHSNFIWVSEDQIERKGAVPNQGSETVISETAAWIL
jgi:hypothetical protein